jgi:HEAT repeat protein
MVKTEDGSSFDTLCLRRSIEGDEEAAIPHLLKLLRSGDENWAVAAATLLGELGGSEAAEGLADALASSLAGLHRAAARTLEQMGRQAVPALIRVLGHPDNHVRWHAARALGRACDPQSIPALLKALEDADSGVRWLAGEALVNMQAEALEPLLKNLVLKPVNAFIKDSTIHVLSRFQGAEQRAQVAPVIKVLKGVDYAALAPVAAYQVLQSLRGAGQAAVPK